MALPMGMDHRITSAGLPVFKRMLLSTIFRYMLLIQYQSPDPSALGRSNVDEPIDIYKERGDISLNLSESFLASFPTLASS